MQPVLGTGQPSEERLDALDRFAIRQTRTINHHDRQTKRARRVQFGLGPSPARILAHHNVDRLIAEQGCVALDGKGASGHDHRVIRQARLCLRHINETQNIVVLGLCGESLHVQAAQSEHHAAGRPAKRRNSSVDIRHMLPPVAIPSLPGRAGQGDQRHTGLAAGVKGVPTHLRGKRVCGVNDMGDVMVAEVADKPLDPTKATNAMRDRLWPWGLDAARIGKHRRNAPLGKSTGQGAGFARAAKNKEVGVHV